jgi:ApaG protein
LSDAITKGVRVRVRARFHEEQSDPPNRFWFFSYTVRITNESSHPVRLVSRHWVITDASGHEEHVRGPGVVGQQPRLQTGESFEYTSGCPLTTSMGTMHGSYQMRMDSGDEFDAEIAPFTLADPLSLN